MARLAHTLSLLALVVVLAAGCGSTGLPPATAPDSGERPGEGAEPPPPPPQPQPPPPTVGGTERVAVSTDGAIADGDSVGVALSGDGRFVVFDSIAGNLVPGDTNDAWDVFVHDRATGVTERISVASDGTQADGDSRDPATSADGRYVAFVSAASNLAPGGAAGRDDVYVHDRATGTTERVSTPPGGGEPDGPSSSPFLSADGRFVAFRSEATNLVDDGGGGGFLVDRTTGDVRRLPAEGAFTLSGDARLLAAEEAATAIVLHDLGTGSSETLDLGAAGGPNGDVMIGQLSRDGTVLTFASLATNLVPAQPDGWGAGWHVFAYDLATRTTELVSVAVDGRPADDFSFAPIPSADGRSVLFASLAHDLEPSHDHVGWSLFLRDRDRGTTRRVPVSTGPTSLYEFGSALSGDGRHVGLTYWASFDADGYTAGVEGVEPGPAEVREVFVHTFAE